MDKLTHFDAAGRARMVDTSMKEHTQRQAIASGILRLHPTTLERIQDNSLKKGNVLAVADIAAVQGAKRTAEWIPLCHSLPLQGVGVAFEADSHIDSAGFAALKVQVTVRCTGPTGVEMEALCATSAALLTVIDMCKSIDREMWIERIQLEEKTGGVRGNWQRTHATHSAE